MKKYLILILICIGFVSCDQINPETLKVTGCDPLSFEDDVDENRTIKIEFNNSVNKQDVEESFSLINPESTVQGSFNWISSRKVEFIPDDPMSEKGRYVITMPRSIRDSDGNIMSEDYISEFYVGTDFTVPVVTSSNPPFTSSAISGIAVNQDIVINFSRSMNKSSVEENFSMSSSVSGYFRWEEAVPGLSNSRLVYVLLSEMDYGKLHTVKIYGDAEDGTGNKLGVDYIVNFITGDDFSPPEFTGFFDSLDTSADPYWNESSLNEGIGKDIKIAMTFSEAMDRKSVEDAFSMTPSVSGTFQWSDDQNVVFNPADILAPETKYLAKIEKSARDIHGHSMLNSHSAEFKTNSADSLYVSCTLIEGGPFKDSYGFLCNVVFYDTPIDTSDWPVYITMDDSAVDTTQIYCLKFTFSADMDQYSIFDNINIKTVKTLPSTTAPGSAVITGVEWFDNRNAVIKIDSMTNSLLTQEPALYRFTLSGGAKGIKDATGNYMKDDLVFEMKEN